MTGRHGAVGGNPFGACDVLVAAQRRSGIGVSIGRVIRQYAFMTRVEFGASCVSACVYLLAAGQGRYVGGGVGIHRPRLLNDGVTSARTRQAQYAGVQAQTRQYLEEMNLPASLHNRMMRTPPDQVAWLTPHELTAFGLTKMIPPVPRPGSGVAR